MNIKKIIREEVNDFEWIEEQNPSRFTLVPHRLEDYVNGDLNLTSNLNILVNERSRDWYSYVGKELYEFYKRSGKNIPQIDMFSTMIDDQLAKEAKQIQSIGRRITNGTRQYSQLGIFVFTGMEEDALIRMFGDEPIYHDHFGEGFDGEWNEEIDDYDEPERGDSHASYMVEVDGKHIIHLGYDHRGLGISVPSDLSAQALADEIMIPLGKEYIDKY